MADSFIMTASQVKVVDDDETVFEASNARRTLSYFTEAAITGTKSLAFHSPPQDTAYLFNAGNSSGSYIETCTSFKTLLSQECGPPGIPDVTMDLTFANTLIGTVPAGTNYLDIQVRLTRTKDPDNFYDQPVRAMQPEGQWMSIQGYAVPLEKMMEFRRHIDFYLDGTNVYLRRFQSTNAAETGIVFDPDNDEDNNGWTYTHTPSTSRFVLLDYKLRQHLGPDWHCMRGGSDACKLDDATKTDLSSTWQVEYIVTPGRLDTQAVPPVAAKPSVRFGGITFTRGSLNSSPYTRTWTGVPFLAAKATRWIVVEVSAFCNAGDDPAGIVSVSIGGVAATKIIERTTDDTSHGGSLWIAKVPAGTSGSVVARWDDASLGQALTVWAVYDLTVNGAYASAGFGNNGNFTSLAVNVPANGVVLAVALAKNGLFGALTGVDNVFTKVDSAALIGGRGTMYASAGQEQTPAAGTRTLDVTAFPSTGNDFPEILLAASFR